MKDLQTILIVDDDEISAFLLERLLGKRFSCEIVLANNGKEALEEMQKKSIKPEIIFFDMRMPVMNGLDFLEKLLQDKELQKIQLIAMSNTFPPEVLKKLENYPFVKKCTKPLRAHDIDELLLES